ncbi:ABC transporter ATP-binding protein [Micromonospora okii]|uniref:ABC transporter ATP-binding protein n=1 Tax=Micromonospora okii TaxID=1182970 RepID=UPI001E522AA6|nr:ATP-binding cassette domain-containing protein [Micromonospora okii]
MSPSPQPPRPLARVPTPPARPHSGRPRRARTGAVLFDGVTKTFPARTTGRGAVGAVTALDRLTLGVSPGEFLVVVGPAGCGKSTLLDLLGGLARPTSGRVLVDGRPVTGPGPDRGLVYPQSGPLPWRTAAGNVAFGLAARGVPPAERPDLTAHHLELAGLAGVADRYPHELPAGLRRRVALARSLAYGPSVLLLDEPLAALDPAARDAAQADLARVLARAGTTVVLATRDVDRAVHLGQRVAVLTAGRVGRVVDVRLGDRGAAGTIRSSAAFRRHRDEITALLHDGARNARAAGRTPARPTTVPANRTPDLPTTPAAARAARPEEPPLADATERPTRLSVPSAALPSSPATRPAALPPSCARPAGPSGGATA